MPGDAKKKVVFPREEERMLDGEYGAAAQEAMGILVKVAEAYGAKRMVQAKSAHVAAGLFLQGVEWYERLLQGGARFRCFTTRHPWSIDYDHQEGREVGAGLRSAGRSWIFRPGSRGEPVGTGAAREMAC